MGNEEQYQILVKSFYQAIINPGKTSFLHDAIKLSHNFDKSTVQQAKAEASVLAVADSKFEA